MTGLKFLLTTSQKLLDMIFVVQKSSPPLRFITIFSGSCPPFFLTLFSHINPNFTKAPICAIVFEEIERRTFTTLLEGEVMKPLSFRIAQSGKALPCFRGPRGYTMTVPGLGMPSWLLPQGQKTAERQEVAA